MSYRFNQNGTNMGGFKGVAEIRQKPQKPTCQRVRTTG